MKIIILLLSSLYMLLTVRPTSARIQVSKVADENDNLSPMIADAMDVDVDVEEHECRCFVLPVCPAKRKCEVSI